VGETWSDSRGAPKVVPYAPGLWSGLQFIPTSLNGLMFASSQMSGFFENSCLQNVTSNVHFA
jgi:hypothetical protein